jgi:alanine dehydrogenase
MKTMILTRSDVARILTPGRANMAVEQAFVALGSGLAEMPPKSYLFFAAGDLRSMPASLHGQGLEAAGLKSVTVHPGNRSQGLPTVMAVIVLIDPDNGFPLAVMDGTYLTGLRTGAAGALAAKLLCRQGWRSAGFVGSGAQARTQLTCTMEVRRLERLKVWRHGRSSSADDFARWSERTYGIETMVHGDIDEVTTGVDLLVTTTPSREPLVRTVSPGTHINAMGADAKGKQEIHPELVKRCTIIVDDWAQASHSGEINVPLGKGVIRRGDIHAELGQIAAGLRPGRSGADEITLFDSTGLAVQDIACARLVYQELAGQEGLHTVDFLG